MVDFGLVARDVAARCGAATVLRVQHYSLAGGGQPFGVVQRKGFGVIEDRQIVTGVPGHSDDVAHGQPGPAAGEPVTGGGFQARGWWSPRWTPAARCAGPSSPREQRPMCGAERVVTALGVPADVALPLSSDGVPSTLGVASSGLHIPGAASLARTASKAARASGVNRAVIGTCRQGLVCQGSARGSGRGPHRCSCRRG